MRLNYDPAGDNSLSGFDRFGRLLDQVWEDYSGTPEAIDRFKYGYSSAGNRTWKENVVAGQLGTPVHLDELYAYDDVDRLIGAERGNLVFDDPNPGDVSIENLGFEQAWGLDGLGNFDEFKEDQDGDGFELEQQREHNTANEIGAIDQGQGQAAWIDPQHDDAGNMTRAPSPLAPDEAQFYVYDAWNRMTKAYEDDGDGQFEPSDAQGGGDDDLIASYERDGLGRRIEKGITAAGGGPYDVDYFYNADWQLLEEVTDDGGEDPSVNQYVWDISYIDAPVARLHDANGDGDLDDEGDTVRYFTWDANHNVTALVGLVEVQQQQFAWQPVERYLYTPYGAVTVLGGSFVPRNPSATQYAWDIGYAGYRLDLETLLHQVRNRYYHSELGRWVSRDPKEYEAGDFNLYRYCGNNPVLYTDPTGLAKVALPAAGAATTNVPMAWYRRPYGFAPFLPQKPNIIKNVGEVKPTNCGIALTGVTGGNHQVAGRPLAPNTYFGVDGAGLCIGVVVVCPTQVVAFHLSATDDAGATLGQYTWPNNCNAVICGGDNSAVSNDQLVEVINSLKQDGIKLDGMINMTGCYYGPGGKWYVGSTTQASQDTQKK